MKNDYECICGILGKESMTPSNPMPPDIEADFDEGEQILESNGELRSAIASFLSSGDAATPLRLKNSLKRIAKFLKTAKARGKDHCAGSAVVETFNAQFKQESAARPDDKQEGKAVANSMEERHPEIVAAAQNIIPQMLFMRFFLMLSPKQRKRLIEFMEDHDLCDDKKAEELRGKIDDKIVEDAKQVNGLEKQVDKGRMDCFDWLQRALFDFFNGITELEVQNQELNASLEEERKRKAATPRGPQEPASQSTEKPEPKPSKDSLEIEVAKLRNELAAKEDNCALKMEAEKAKLIAEYEGQASSLKASNQLLENEMAKTVENCDRKLKLSAHVFETFLGTLPRRYSAPGYVMLRSIVNEWDGDLQSIQAKESKYAPKTEASTSGKSFWNALKARWWIIAILVIILVAICVDAIMRVKQVKNVAETHTTNRSESVAEQPRASAAQSSEGTDETLSLIDSFQRLQDRRKPEAAR